MMVRYNLYVKGNGHWDFVCEIEAADHSEALRSAMTKLKPEHYSKQIRLEQEEPPEQMVQRQLDQRMEGGERPC